MSRFAVRDDVIDRFEDQIPSSRLEWVDTRIDDVEAVLMGLVPTLAGPFDEIDEGRKARAKALVCDKVLDLYRNPGRVNQQSTASGPYSESTTYTSGSQRGVGGIAFSEDELRLVRPGRRSRFGMVAVSPWDARRNIRGGL